MYLEAVFIIIFISDADVSYIRKNFLIVNIFYGKLYYTTLEEQPAYGFIEAMCKFQPGCHRRFSLIGILEKSITE